MRSRLSRKIMVGATVAMLAMGVMHPMHVVPTEAATLTGMVYDVSVDAGNDVYDPSHDKDMDDMGRQGLETEDENTEGAAMDNNGNAIVWGLLLAAVALLLTALGLLAHGSKKYVPANLNDLFSKFDLLYDKYNRDYAHCVQEILKAERSGAEEKYKDVTAIREDIKKMFVTMTDARRQYEELKVNRGKTGKMSMTYSVDTMNNLCEKSESYSKRMERYLAKLQEINMKHNSHSACA